MHILNVMQRAYYLRLTPNSVAKFKHCDLITQSEELFNYVLLSSSSSSSSNNLDKVYDVGYQEAKKQLEIYFEKR